MADWRQLFAREIDYVHRTLRRLGVSASDADDLVQEVFLVAWRRRADFQPGGSLRPWLAAIAFRIAIAHRRRRAREVPGGLVDREDPAPRLDDEVAAAGERARVLAALATLPPNQRVVLVLYELDELPMKEIAAALEVPLFTAYSRLRVARQGFARAIRRQARAAVVPALGASELFRRERVTPWPPAPATVKVTLGARPWGDPRRALPVRALGVAAVVSLAGGFVALLAPRAAAPAAAVAAVARPPGSPVVVRRDSPVRARPPLFPPPPVDRAMAAELARGLVGYWRFDEGVGALVARDLTGQGADCQVRRADSLEWVDGPLGGAVALRGGGYLECPSSPALLAIDTEITVAAWVLRAQPQPHLRAVVSRQHGSNRHDDFLLAFGGDRLLFASREWRMVEAPLPPIYRRWMHVAATRDPAGFLALYRDGVEIARVARPRPPGQGRLVTTPYANAIIIGAASNGVDPGQVNQKLNGSIDDVLIYDRALGPGEIAALADRVQPRAP